MCSPTLDDEAYSFYFNDAKPLKILSIVFAIIYFVAGIVIGCLYCVKASSGVLLPVAGIFIYIYILVGLFLALWLEQTERITLWRIANRQRNPTAPIPEPTSSAYSCAFRPSDSVGLMSLIRELLARKNAPLLKEAFNVLKVPTAWWLFTCVFSYFSLLYLKVPTWWDEIELQIYIFLTWKYLWLTVLRLWKPSMDPVAQYSRVQPSGELVSSIQMNWRAGRRAPSFIEKFEIVLYPAALSLCISGSLAVLIISIGWPFAGMLVADLLVFTFTFVWYEMSLWEWLSAGLGRED